MLVIQPLCGVCPADLNITTINSPFVTMVRIVDLIPFLSIEMREDVIGVVRAIADAIFHDGESTPRSSCGGTGQRHAAVAVELQ